MGSGNCRLPAWQQQEKRTGKGIRSAHVCDDRTTSVCCPVSRNVVYSTNLLLGKINATRSVIRREREKKGMLAVLLNILTKNSREIRRRQSQTRPEQLLQGFQRAVKCSSISWTGDSPPIRSTLSRSASTLRRFDTVTLSKPFRAQPAPPP